MKRNHFRVKLKAFDVKLLDIGVANIVESVKKTGTNIIGPIPLPTKIEKFTVLRSPHVNKKSREQFEMRTHTRLIEIVNPSTDVMASLMKLELPAGVDVQLKQ